MLSPHFHWFDWKYLTRVIPRYGADVNSMSDTGSTPVRSACFMTHLDIVKLLVKRPLCHSHVTYIWLHLEFRWPTMRTSNDPTTTEARAWSTACRALSSASSCWSTGRMSMHRTFSARQPSTTPSRFAFFSDTHAIDIWCWKMHITFHFQEHRFETTKLLLSYGANPWLESRYRDDALQTACLKVGIIKIFILSFSIC